jgi:4-hydroxy-tetrahydrodipicolinate reductase
LTSPEANSPEPRALRLLLVGYGKMGKIVERLAPDYGFNVVGHLDDTNNIGAVGVPSAPDADIAVEFSVPSAVPENLPQLAARRMNVVIGTTGWHEHEEKMRRIAADAGIGVLVGGRAISEPG